MSNKPFDLSKCERNEHGHYLCETHDGQQARIICVDRCHGTHPVIALIRTCNEDVIWCFKSDGNRDFDSVSLINIPRKFKRWVNITRVNGVEYCSIPMTKDEAERLANTPEPECGPGQFIATVPIEWEEP